MPDLYLGGALQSRMSTAASAGPRNTSPGVPVTATAPATVSTAAFGTGYSGQPQSRGALLHPGKPMGLAFWVGVAALGALIVIHHSLPR